MDQNRVSLGAGSGGLTYSTLANVPKAKRQKLISEAKPMVKLIFNILSAWWSSQMQGSLASYPQGRFQKGGHSK
jgi:hypothetical protein